MPPLNLSLVRVVSVTSESQGAAVITTRELRADHKTHSYEETRAYSTSQFALILGFLQHTTTVIYL